METKEIAAIQKPILEAIERLCVPLSAIALLKMIDEFYTKEERVALYAEYEALRDADAEAYEHLLEADPPDAPSRKDLVERFGEHEANERLAPRRLALEAKQAAGRGIREFEREHRLIVRLAEAKAEIGKARYNK
ncbi:hypothetical protein ASG35_08530 [Burkholderia sp. Leaf177]|uniref:hypothetical protein n=1 Tax=Burkholderia sp. Leaf177 TaxID=1736287 RepID=UPI0006FFEE13|nr:hypothetical protein [Burkholderia sp. Leaf177]KQR78475.1 hypothetical protein ASG35_08530 [Burkholderia sp. Leaf177]